jgi:transcriptional regulator with XRE-family HTH domain
METEITDKFVAQSLRSIRQAQSLSLNDVEVASRGAIKAVVLGSYERGSRSLSVKRAIQISQFYGVPVSVLFGGSLRADAMKAQRIIIDARRLRTLVEMGSQIDQAIIKTLLSYVSHIQSSRQDWNGEVISLRERDTEYIAICTGYTPESLVQWLDGKNLLLTFKN